MFSKFRSGFFVAAIFMLALILAACGDSPTATPAPATSAAAAATTAAPAATVAATTARATTAAATTVAATTAAPTTARATTAAAATTAASSSVSVELPAISGLTEVPLDPAFVAEFNKQVPIKGGVVFKLYVSDDDAAKVSETLDAALTKAGYKFGIPGSTKPEKQDDSYMGLYVKTGAADLLTAAGPVPTDPTKLDANQAIPGLSQEAYKKMVEQIKNKKTMLIVLGAPNLLQSLMSGAGTTTPSSTSAPATTAAATVAVASPAAATSGNGELVGQLVAAGDNDIKVTKVERFESLTDGSKTVTPKGVFMVIAYKTANVGKKPSAFNFVKLVDDKNREFDTTSDYDASNILSSKYGYKSTFVVNPGFVGDGYSVYDVPKDATGFKLVADDFLGKTSRQPSAESFTASGGKGDSGAGPELSGKSIKIEKDKVELKVSKVERLTELKDGSKSFKAEGVYLIVAYDLSNNGDKPSSYASFNLKDSAGRIFGSTTDFDIAYAAAVNYKADSTINPGQSGVGFKVFEVTKDAAGFELTAEQ